VSTRYICIHGHFYQPPRENPWLEEVEREESARPYHDWNERITFEAYAPNAFSRILDERGRIARIVNNYSRISFNFGPTLLAWMEREAPETYRAILAADRTSQERFSGHGSAMAQAYNHMILPLASTRDRRTQILWGIRDFEHRFGRPAAGMWLPETAVDLESLDLMAEAGIRFTVLAPHQAAAVREGEGAWDELRGGSPDTSRSYRVRLPSGREIAVFFYDGPLSQAVAFETLLADGAAFAGRLLEADARHGEGGLTHIATDGETYGHHHRHGDMALAFALRRIEEEEGVLLTNYAEHLERHPPTMEARIREHSSWSCAHGTERWRADCGCSTGAHPEWNQRWRRPLREAMDWLRDRLEPLYEEAMGELVEDPWGARDRYIELVLDRSPGNVGAFLEREARRPPGEGARTRARGGRGGPAPPPAGAPAAPPPPRRLELPFFGGPARPLRARRGEDHP
jgi:alpha-amylase/alpha-mannosidase (GH57 family)